MLSHINKLKTLAEQLDAVGAPVSVDDTSRKSERVVPVPDHGIGVVCRYANVGTRDVSATA